MWLIELTLQASDSNMHRIFSKDHILIGRAESNDFVLQDPRISSLHGQIVLRNNSFVYQDLQSTNGSMVQRGEDRFVVDGVKFKELPLLEGDLLLLGDVSSPTEVAVRIFEGEAEGDSTAAEGKTILASRAISDFSLLSQPILDNKSTVRSLFRFQKEIHEAEKANDIYQQVALFLLNHIPNAEYVSLHREEGELKDTWRQVYFTSKTKDVSQEINGGQELFDNATREKRAYLIDRAQLSRLRNSLSEAQPLNSMVLAPLIHQEKILGFIEVGNTESCSPLDLADLDLVSVIAYALSSRVVNLRLMEVIRLAEKKLKNENLYLRSKVEPSEAQKSIIGESAAMQSVRRQIETVGPSNLTVMILGETGTGKELVARSIHEHSNRAGQIFAAVNCGTFSDTLLESELFGHIKGSFTGAVKDKKGLFEVADGGSLFLDEIGETPYNLQVKLLRSLQEGEVMPVGATKPIKVDVRLICATNKDLEQEVSNGNFREDLFYRINTFPIQLPSLRERKDDIPLLIKHFLREYQREMRKYDNDISEKCLQELSRCEWPGNVRQLRNETQRALLLVEDNKKIEIQHFSPQISKRTRQVSGEPVDIGGRSLKQVMEDYEIKVIRQALEEHGWNRSKTAQTLGISRQAFMVKLSKFSITPDK